MEEKENNTLAYEILQDMKKQNKRIFILAMIVISLLFIYIGYDRYKDSINDTDSVEDKVYQYFCNIPKED